MSVSYCVDARDVITAVGGDWDRFASENGGVGLDPSAVVGTSLMDFVQGTEVRWMIRSLLDFTRSRAAPFQMVYRCDSADAKQSFRMILKPQRDGSIGLIHQDVGVKLRERPIARRHVPHATARALPVCGVCAAIRVHSRWWREDEAHERGIIADADRVTVTAGLCGDCREMVARRIHVADPTYFASDLAS